MTTPDLPGAVAALTGTVTALGIRLQLLGPQVDGKASREQVDALTARFEELAALVADVLEAESPKGPAAINWTEVDEDEYRKTLAELAEWVNGIFLPGYPSTGLAGCWQRHPQAVTELSNIWLSWIHAYSRKRPDLRLALEWHERWMPGVMKRIEHVTRHCLTGCKAQG